MKKILFVCLGNICRSPAAEGIMQVLVQQKAGNGKTVIDSAGITGYHVGEPADSRMKRYAKERGYLLTSVSRKFDSRNDFQRFDFIIAMDNENLQDLKSLDPNKQYNHKIFKMTDFCLSRNETTVPDPYYGGAKGFELVLDILEDACKGLLKKLDDGD